MPKIGLTDEKEKNCEHFYLLDVGSTYMRERGPALCAIMPKKIKANIVRIIIHKGNTHKRISLCNARHRCLTRFSQLKCACDAISMHNYTITHESDGYLYVRDSWQVRRNFFNDKRTS